jgi:hypothetical protein
MKKLLWLIPYSLVAIFLILFSTVFGPGAIVGSSVISAGGAIALIYGLFKNGG